MPRRKKGGQLLMEMHRRNMPYRGERHITYRPDVDPSLSESRDVFQEGYVHPLALKNNYAASYPMPKRSAVPVSEPSIAEEIDPYLDRLNEVEIGITDIEDTIAKQRRRKAEADAAWTERVEKRKELEEELSRPKPPPPPPPPPPPEVKPLPMPVEKKPPAQAPVAEAVRDEPWKIKLDPEQEKEFQAWWNTDHNVQQWLYEFEREYGERPGPDSHTNYDYRKAWLGGANEHPVQVEEEDGRWRYHWGSAGKHEDHPTYHAQFEGGGGDRQVMMVEYESDLKGYIQNLLDARIPLPRYLYIKDIDQEIDLLGKIKDEDGNPLAEKWFADGEMLQSKAYQKEFENAVAPVTKEQLEKAKKGSSEESSKRIQDLLDEYEKATSKLDEALKKAKGK